MSDERDAGASSLLLELAQHQLVAPARGEGVGRDDRRTRVECRGDNLSRLSSAYERTGHHDIEIGSNPNQATRALAKASDSLSG